MSSEILSEISTISQIILECCREISNHVRNSQSDVIGQKTGDSNTSCDDVKKLDLISNQIFKDRLSCCPLIKGIASEEEENVIWYDNKGCYLCVFDPLDGSQNIDINLPIGSIFGIFRIDNTNGEIPNGRSLMMSGYSLYCGATLVVMGDTISRTLSGHRLVDNQWVDYPIKVFQEPHKYYSINECNFHHWNPEVRTLVNDSKKSRRTQRWIGSLVGDGHRTLLKGGFFSYPVDSRNTSGKLRLFYEAYPFALIFELAGGTARNDLGAEGKNILDIPIPWENVHQKTGLFLMDKEIV